MFLTPTTKLKCFLTSLIFKDVINWTGNLSGLYRFISLDKSNTLLQEFNLVVFGPRIDQLCIIDLTRNILLFIKLGCFV